MYCPDCEMEVEKLTKEGICLKCTARKNNMMYKDRVNNTNIGYIPIKNLKGTTEYNRVMGRRLSELNKKESKSSLISKTSDIINQSNTENIKKSIQKDLEMYYNKYNIKPTDNYIPLEIIFEWFYELCQEENYFNTLELKKKIYDTLIVNTLHELKSSIKDPKFYAILGEKIALIQDLRTPIDNECDKYKTIQEVFNHLKEDKEFQKLLSTARTNLLNIIEKQKDPKYLTEAPSMQDYDFVQLPKKEEKPKLRKLNNTTITNKYYFKIKRVKYLYGNSNYQEFIYSGFIYATNEKEATQKFKDYIGTAFPSLVYNSKDIVISLTPFTEKECL